MTKKDQDSNSHRERLGESWNNAWSRRMSESISRCQNAASSSMVRHLMSSLFQPPNHQNPTRIQKGKPKSHHKNPWETQNNRHQDRKISQMHQKKTSTASHSRSKPPPKKPKFFHIHGKETKTPIWLSPKSQNANHTEHQETRTKNSPPLPHPDPPDRATNSPFVQEGSIRELDLESIRPANNENRTGVGVGGFRFSLVSSLGLYIYTCRIRAMEGANIETKRGERGRREEIGRRVNNN